MRHAGARSMPLQVELPPIRAILTARGADGQPEELQPRSREGFPPRGRKVAGEGVTAACAVIAPPPAATRYANVLSIRAAERALIAAGWSHREAKADASALARETHTPP